MVGGKAAAPQKRERERGKRERRGGGISVEEGVYGVGGTLAGERFRRRVHFLCCASSKAGCRDDECVGLAEVSKVLSLRLSVGRVILLSADGIGLGSLVSIG